LRTKTYGLWVRVRAFPPEKTIIVTPTNNTKSGHVENASAQRPNTDIEKIHHMTVLGKSVDQIADAATAYHGRTHGLSRAHMLGTDRPQQSARYEHLTTECE